jgi:hypothetical protein
MHFLNFSLLSRTEPFSIVTLEDDESNIFTAEEKLSGSEDIKSEIIGF